MVSVGTKNNAHDGVEARKDGDRVDRAASQGVDASTTVRDGVRVGSKISGGVGVSSTISNDAGASNNISYLVTTISGTSTDSDLNDMTDVGPEALTSVCLEATAGTTGTSAIVAGIYS
jgi:hypothetical protein